MFRLGRLFLCVAWTLPAASAVYAESYSRTAGENFPQRVFWGDTHVHSSWSPDAASLGNSRLGPEAAYRFARGEEIVAHNGMRAKLRRPLDFLVLADHAEFLGLFPELEAGNPALLQTEAGSRWRQWLEDGPDGRSRILDEFSNALWTNTDVIGSEEFTRLMWQRVTANADRFNQPGRFTAFIGYEWSSTPAGANLHRVVVFRDGAERANRVLPFSSFDGQDPAALWDYLREYERETGGAALAIPHNGNTSAGRMFAAQDFGGLPISHDHAIARSRWEPLVEVTQYKGDSETHPAVSPDDEFADFESWDQFAGFTLAPHDDAMFRSEYARPALRAGLKFQRELGANPFKFGMIGSTDSHTSLATAEEDNYWGKFTIHEPRQGRVTESFTRSASFPQFEWEMAASGYAAIWATENTREALFAAMQRRETYATTGPRITVRFFGGWNYRPEDINRPDYVAVGYRSGVPMGGDLTNAPEDGTPRFLIIALKDPDGANLDRIQIIKGWVDDAGHDREKIYDVAISDGRSLAAPTSIGSTVNVTDASYTNTIGSPQLATFWRDPDFNPAQEAFYYARVIEIPTPRWPAYDAKYFGTELPDEVPVTLQERAYTSPIWYTP